MLVTLVANEVCCSSIIILANDVISLRMALAGNNFSALERAARVARRRVATLTLAARRRLENWRGENIALHEETLA